ncbi:hypothetical protein NM688_g6094 [Phlebia brevispora]|uniref:Uncharacterized protein n=1 Tax=Phlebia brevispora TaxID=194682 RepID=A0ACC1SJX7_9APHY|nr:hypothetical protein NM688_g6094 [Phlebia brevispora]
MRPNSPLVNKMPSMPNPAQLPWSEIATATDPKILKSVLYRFQRILRFVHKRKIMWPTEDAYPSDLRPSEYLSTLLQPVADLFNQLHSPEVLETPMECVQINFAEASLSGVTFTAEDLKHQDVLIPITLSLPDELFTPNGEVAPPVQIALSNALHFNSSAWPIIITNFQNTALFFPPSEYRPNYTFERVSTNEVPLALQIITAAYFSDVLPYGLYIAQPSIDLEVDKTLVLPEGPPKDPSQSLMSDEEVLATHHRHSDFDLETLIRDRKRALQFFRWRECVQKKYSKLTTHPNDVLTAVTHEVGQIIPENRPIYPFDVSELPADTDAYMKSVRRVSPLMEAGIAEAFERSQSFMLKIEDVLPPSSQRTICTLHRCRITHINNKPVSSPALCLKLFDDRFQQLKTPNEDSQNSDELVPRWFDRLVIAETYALNETFAYNKLQIAQGSVFPWFYGMHQFTLPDGTVLYGLLMEYIAGHSLDSQADLIRKWGADRQIQLIQSCRHAARILDLGDVSQKDWHAGQIMVFTNPLTNLDQAVLVDFASTTQTYSPDQMNFLQNYFHVLHILLGRRGDVGLQENLVWKHFGEPDDWDPVAASFPLVPWGDEYREVQARDMFPSRSTAFSMQCMSAEFLTKRLTVPPATQRGRSNPAGEEQDAWI